MITRIAIENFKGVRDRIEIPVAPITLLFGANSAGKSSVLHALHFAREVFVRRNLDVDRTESGGEVIDLGGFRNLLHARDTTKAVTLEFSLDLSNRDLPTYGQPDDHRPTTDLSALVKSAIVSVAIAWSDARQAPFVREYSATLNGRPFASIRCDGKPSGYVQLVEINHNNPILLRADESGVSLLGPLVQLYGQGSAILRISSIALEGMHDALPMLDVPLPFPFEREAPRAFGHQGQLFETGEHPLFPFAEADVVTADTVAILSQLLIGPAKVLADYLETLRYVGPLRATPPRNYSLPRFPDESRWADGMAAWDELSRNASLTRQVSEWMSSEDRLDAGCSLALQRIRLLDETSELYQVLASGRSFDDADDLAHQFRSLPVEQRLVVWSEAGNMLPHDVGVGVSQLLPVVVALLSSADRPIVLEQPELHVHPRLQAEIADVLIEASRSPNDKLLFVETHSEHLILRLLRRIRETTEKELPAWHSGFNCERLSVVYLTGVNEPTQGTNLRVTPEGDFLDRWPNGFFEERPEELF